MADFFPIAEARGEKRASVVFFHGLDGDAHTTWLATSDDSSFWPARLAQDIEGLAVYSGGYDAPASDRNHASMHPSDLASNALNRLLVEFTLRKGDIFLLGHTAVSSSR